MPLQLLYLNSVNKTIGQNNTSDWIFLVLYIYV